MSGQESALYYVKDHKIVGTISLVFGLLYSLLPILVTSIARKASGIDCESDIVALEGLTPEERYVCETNSDTHDLLAFEITQPIINFFTVALFFLRFCFKDMEMEKSKRAALYLANVLFTLASFSVSLYALILYATKYANIEFNCQENPHNPHITNSTKPLLCSEVLGSDPEADEKQDVSVHGHKILADMLLTMAGILSIALIFSTTAEIEAVKDTIASLPSPRKIKQKLALTFCPGSTSIPGEQHPLLEHAARVY